VCRDDYDADNDSYHMLEKTRELTTPTGKDGLMSSALDDYYFDNEASVVVGFTAKGPVRANKDDPGVSRRSPDQLLEATVLEHRRAQGAVEQLSDRARERELAADEAESKASHFTHLSGWSTDQVKERALRLQQGSSSSGFATRDIEEEKSTKDEGLEVHEVLPELVEGSRGRYEQAAREAMEGAGHEAQCHALLKEKEVALRMARENLSMAQERESAVSENAKKARSEAIANQEHAEVARERVLKVRDLLKNCKDQTSTAGTVVQTALTEAKISEKRAADAEARASRAQQAADADRKRAEDETRKEELLEQQVNDLHDDCMRATEATRDARERLEKAASMLERVNDQLKIIETSSQYRAEVQAKSSSEGHGVPRGGSFLAKHTAKLDEREMCRELIREASEEAASADAHRKELQRAFEDRAYQWRVQADLAAAARRTADRSLHVADELLEQAEEEREAANLRHTARQRAEATVENRGSHRSSLEAQLVEAERAAAEAANVALQSKKRAEHLAREADKLKDHSRFQKVLEDLEWERDMAKQEYDAARADRERKDRAMADEKRRLDTNSAVCKEATREAAVETDRTREEQHYQQEAIVAYSEALACRQEASDSLDQLNELRIKSESRRMAVDRAKEYKSRMDMMIELPLDLSRLTMFHSTKYLNWSRSMSLSKAEMHSFAHNVLLLMLDKNPDDERRNLHSFTKNHLCRVYPSWKALQNKNFTNYDPVFAWALGCQMVSSNLHSADESLLVADGRFRQNGSCGYVLKPPYLLDNISKTESDQRWSLQVMSGHNLPRPSSRKASGPASPLVKISVYSGSHKETRISYRTRPARHVGLHPVWTTNNKFELTIPIASVSMVSFSVWHVMEDGAEAFMGAAALPASCLREGFRSVALFDEHHSRSGEYRNACLLVKTTRR
jgi:Phosphatidylinositol-specific phospholipase C, Y domain/C2 domain